MIGSIVFCWTLASIRSTTCPPLWIRPRTGGLSFASVPRPGAPASRPRPPGGAGRAPPLGDVGRPALVAGDDVALVDLDLALEPHRRHPGDQAGAEALGHELHVGLAQAQ